MNNGTENRIKSTISTRIRKVKGKTNEFSVEMNKEKVFCEWVEDNKKKSLSKNHDSIKFICWLNNMMVSFRFFSTILHHDLFSDLLLLFLILNLHHKIVCVCVFVEHIARKCTHNDFKK